MESINQITRKLAPHITRQRFLIEGFFTAEINKDVIEAYLHNVAAHLDLRTYGEPTIYSPEEMGKEENAGYDAFIPLIDSGISLYAWTGESFISVLFYTCKYFSEEEALSFTQNAFAMKEGIETHLF